MNRTREELETQADRICNAISDKYVEINQLLIQLQELHEELSPEPMNDSDGERAVKILALPA
jgi:flagellar hook-associated protein FlgK